MSYASGPMTVLRRAAFPLLLAALLFAVTEAPYARGRASSPPGSEFVGHLYYFDDLNMYFSFIRQAADGHLLFVDRLTYVAHRPVFFNLEWLGVGRAMRVLAGSDNAAFVLWRASGIAALVFGFAAFAAAAGVDGRRRRLALVLFLTGGGFGWLVQALELTQAIPRLDGPWHYLKLDLMAGLHPFVQALLNPHFSLPHGLLLLLLALFLRAEASGRASTYAGAAAAAILCGLSRPYDLIALWAAIPVYHLSSPDRFDHRRLFRRALPLAATAPLLAYYALLFGRHPVFRWWASQGEMAPIPLVFHVLALGLVGVVAAVRLVRGPALAGAADRFCLVWSVVLLFLVHAHVVFRFMPYSSQLLTSSLAPIVVLAVPALRWRDDGAGQGPSRAWLPLFVAVNALSSAGLLVQKWEAVTQPAYHLRGAERRAFDWLARHAAEDDVILSRRADGNRLGRYVSARVALGHYSVTPDAAALETLVDAFFEGAMSADVARSLVDEVQPAWVYARGADVERLDAAGLAGAERVFSAGDVAIYRVSAVGQARSDGSAHGGAGGPGRAPAPAPRSTASTRTVGRAYTGASRGLAKSSGRPGSSTT
jgi:hypothetical protein